MKKTILEIINNVILAHWQAIIEVLCAIFVLLLYQSRGLNFLPLIAKFEQTNFEIEVKTL